MGDPRFQNSRRSDCVLWSNHANNFRMVANSFFDRIQDREGSTGFDCDCHVSACEWIYSCRLWQGHVSLRLTSSNREVNACNRQHASQQSLLLRSSINGCSALASPIAK